MKDDKQTEIKEAESMWLRGGILRLPPRVDAMLGGVERQRVSCAVPIESVTSWEVFERLGDSGTVLSRGLQVRLKGGGFSISGDMSENEIATVCKLLEWYFENDALLADLGHVIVTPDGSRFPRAVLGDAKKGWVLDPGELAKVRNRADAEGDGTPVALETVEAIIMAWEKLRR